MSVAQIIKQKTVRFVKKEKPIAILPKLLLNFVLGFFFGSASLGDSFAPFGVAFSSAADSKMFPAALLGACVGYILGGDSLRALRYCAALMALGVIYAALRSFKVIKENILIPAAASFSCLFVTGLAIAFSKEADIASVLGALGEALLGGAASYLLLRVRSVLALKGSFFSLTSKESVAVVTAGSLLLLSIKDFSFFTVYPAHIAAMLAVLFCGRFAREAGGAVVGICCGAVLCIENGDLFLFSALSLGGLVCGAAAAFGKIAAFLGLFLTGASLIVVESADTLGWGLLAEALISGAIFLLMPKKLASKIESALTPAATSPCIDGVKTDIRRRLKNASEMSSEICESLNTVSQALLKSERNDIGSVCRKTKDAVCGSCGLFDACWNDGFEDTKDSFNTLITMKKEGTYLEYKTVPQKFSAKCIRTEMVASSINKLYSEFKVKESIDSRVNEIYTLASEQFINVSSLLDSLCDNLSGEVLFDSETSREAGAAASRCGFKPVKANCIKDGFDRLSLELTLSGASEADFSLLSKQLEIITNKKLSSPEITRSRSQTILYYKERPELRAVFAGSQICCNTEKYSGDTYSVFRDGDGNFYAVICDGMGTGMRAAVNSNLAVSLFEKLIKAGFGVQAAISTVNTCLISKSGDECSVTLDLVRIDLYTGHIDLFKCGAAPTYVKKQGRMLRVDCPSLPLGIIKETESRNGTGTLSAGDVLVMVSDGVRDEDEELLRSELKAFNSGNVREFANNLCEAVKEAQPEKNDDITVLAVAVTDRFE